MYRIAKEFAFSASHALIGLPEGHPCSRVHGHNYVVTMLLESPYLDEYGFVRDYGDLKVVKDWLDEYMDHQHLNDILESPTAEHIALKLYNVFRPLLPELVAVRVSETPKTWAEYRDRVPCI